MADITPTETYNPARAAAAAGIPPSTLRLWAKVYNEFMSPGANPPPGEERRFTAADVEVMRAVAQLRANQLQPPEIIARLRSNPAETLQKPLESTVSPSAIGNDLATSHDAIQTFLARGELKDQLQSVDRRLERLESQRNLVIVAVLAFAAGAVVVSVIVWLLGMVR